MRGDSTPPRGVASTPRTTKASAKPRPGFPLSIHKGSSYWCAGDGPSRRELRLRTNRPCPASRAGDRLDGGWIDFARVKAAVPRRVPLWPETVAAVRGRPPERPRAKDAADAGLLFPTCRGGRWVKVNAKGHPPDAIRQEFAKLLRWLDLQRPGVAFYALHHGITDSKPSPVRRPIRLPSMP